MTRLGSAFLAAAAIAMAGVAHAQMAHDGHGMDMESMQDLMMQMMPAGGDAPSTRAFKEADMTMMRDMAVTYTGNADIDFRTKMIPHHQGAIAMARAALEYATDPETRALAQGIIAAQEKEIADMQAWLAAHPN